MDKRTAVFLADGFEEIEALTVVDILRRMKVTVDMISISNQLAVVGSHGIEVSANLLLSQVEWVSYDCLFLPGGMPGTIQLESCEELLNHLTQWYHENRLLAAICAAPRILGKLGFMEGRMGVVYPGHEEYMLGATLLDSECVRDEFIITGRGMGCSVPFALLVAESLLGKEAADQMRDKIIYMH